MEDIKNTREWRHARHSLMKSANTYRGICEVLREVYDNVYQVSEVELRDKMTDLLIEASIMAKKINDRLIYYFKTYADKTGHRANNIQKIGRSGLTRYFRRNRKPL